MCIVLRGTEEKDVARFHWHPCGHSRFGTRKREFTSHLPTFCLGEAQETLAVVREGDGDDAIACFRRKLLALRGEIQLLPTRHRSRFEQLETHREFVFRQIAVALPKFGCSRG